MRWFQGGIAEAIATSKSRNAIFVVFVHGQDGVSQEVTRVVNDQRVSSRLESADFVAITLDSDSEAYRQFQQIYHLVPVPSLFFIGENGVPLEVIAGRIEEAELVRRIETVLEENRKKSKPEDKPSEPVSKNANVDLQSVAKEETEKPAQVASVGSEPSSSTAAEAAASPVEVTAKVETSEPKEEPSSVPVVISSEEKVDRAKELLETKRKQKQEDDEEKQREKELERRKVGQDVQKLRRWQQDQELKQLKEERQREKAEEAAVRERILKQIAQDRAERAARNSVEKKAAEQEAKKLPVQESTSTSNVSRIQFRLPDGSAHSHNFEPMTTLAEVTTYAVTQLNLPFREFLMSTTFPRREFTSADNNQTLRDLQLVPTAVILILPTSSGAVVTSSQSYSEVFTRMVMSFFTPLFSLITYLRNLVFGGGGTGAAAAGGVTTGSTLGAKFGLNNLRKDASSQNSTGARRRKPAETSVHRQGNIHRLTNNRDSSDDENNTWNGNSTQQM